MTSPANKRPLRVSIALIVLALTAATACSDASEPAAVGEEREDRGREVYASSCASCHGDRLQGTEKGPPQLSVVYEPGHHPDASYESAIVNGAPQHHWNFGDMPPVEDVTQDEIEAVIAYIRAEQQRLGFEPYPPE